MSRRSIIITESDRRVLEQLLTSEFADAIDSKSYLADLRTELERADIVDSADVPHDVVTMNSTVRLRDLDSGDTESYTLVYPDRANIAENKLSILAPIGTAVLGYRVGDVITWRVPSGQRRVQVEEVLDQPERRKAFPLGQQGIAGCPDGQATTCGDESRGCTGIS